MKSIPFVGVFALTAGVALAQSGGSVVEQIFAEAEQQMGLTSSARSTGRLPQGGLTSVFVQIAPNTSYMLIGVCDEGCSDLDLVVRDPSGATVGVDRELDANPVIMVPAGAGGRFTFQVEMATCSSDCHWGVRAYQRY